MSGEYVKEINESNFKSLTANGIVLVDFSATWCGPCRMLAPILEEVAGNMKGELDVYKLDIDESQSLAELYHVTSVPTIVLFKDGKEVDRSVGLRDAQAIENMVKSVQN